MTNRKTWLPLILAMILAFCFVSTALAAPGDNSLFVFTEGNDTNIISLAAEGDTLYTLSYSGILYHYQTGMEQAEIAAQNIETGQMHSSIEAFEKSTGKSASIVTSHIYLHGGQLYGLNMLTGEFSTITLEGGMATLTPLATMDVTPMMIQDGNGIYPADIADSVFTGDTLYMLTLDRMNGWGAYTLIAYSLADGQAKVCTTQHIQAITPYQEGKLLVSIYDQENAYNDPSGQERFPELHIFDLATDTTQKMMEFDNSGISGLRYQQSNDTLYYFTSGTVMMMPALGTPTLAAYMPTERLNSNYLTALMGDNLYVAATYNGTFIKNTDPANLPTESLTIYGGYANDATIAFSIQNPGVALTFSEEYYDGPQALGQAMVSGENALDVFMIDMSYGGLDSMMRKGYCLDLSGNEAITQTVGKMYPFIQNALSIDSKLYAIPLSMYPTTTPFSYANDVLAATDLTPENLPTNYIELCQFINQWNNEWMEKFEGIRPLYWEDIRTALYYEMMSSYVAYYQQIEGDLRFDTPLFRSLLTALESMDSSNLDLSENASMEEMDAIWENMFLLEPGQGASLVPNYDYTFLPMPLSPDTAPMIGMNIQIMFVNPRSQNLDSAMKLAQCYLETMNMETQMTMRPDLNDPVENPSFAQNVASLENKLAQLEASLAACAPEEKKNLEDQIADTKSALADQENSRYTVTAQDIANYRINIAPLMFGVKQEVLNTQNEGAAELQNLQSRYLDKQITLDQFIAQADEKVQMILQERK